MITLRVQNTSTFIDESYTLDKTARDALRLAIGFKDEASEYRASNIPGYDGIISTLCYGWGKKPCRCAVEKKGMHFPSGLLGRVKTCFKAMKIPFNIVDERPPVDRIRSYTTNPLTCQARDYQIDIVNIAVPWGRGIVKLATGGGKCLAKGTPVLMYDGTIKLVENIIKGDLLMGPDSTSRQVLGTCRGRERMYQVNPVKGDPYVVNESHILSLKVYERRCQAGKRITTQKVTNIAVVDFLKQSKTFKAQAKGYRCAIDFQPQPIGLDPYYLGLWLGDGSSRGPEVNTADLETKKFLQVTAANHGLRYWENQQQGNASATCYLSSPKGKKGRRSNPLRNALTDLSVIHNKHVPHAYRCNSRDVRLQVLAGLMDSDGSPHHGGYDFVSINHCLADDVAFIARSLGLAAYVKPCRKTCVNNGVVGNYFRVSISGDCSVIPVRIRRKAVPVRRQIKNVLNTSIKVESIGEGDYYGFEIGGDHLFVLGDFTVTHNTGTAARLMAEIGAFPFIFFVPSKDLLAQAAREFERFLLKDGKPIKVGRVGGGHREIGDITVMTIQTAIRALDPDRFAGKKGRKKKGKKLIDDEDEELDDRDDDDLGEFYLEVRKLLFYCKGFICDEVQHWASETCQLVADYCHNASYRYGFSATPWRDKGDDMLIDACFGKAICDINASYLIDRGYLVPANIFFVPIANHKYTQFETYQLAYEDAIVNNDIRNRQIVDIAQNLCKDGRMVLILVKHIAHGELLEKMIPDAVFIHGAHSGKIRDGHLEKMRNHQAPVTIASTIFDEGIDVRPLDGVILAGGGKSQTRALQRIGRAIRPYSCDGYEKINAVIVDFYDDAKWMRNHANKRKRIYETEPRFIIKKLKPAA